MTRHGSRNLYLATPLRLWFRRVALLLLIAGGAALVVLDRAESPFAERIRTSIQDLAAPVLDAASAPVDMVGDWIGSIGELYAVEEQNTILREQLATLKTWRAEAQRLATENAQLRKMLNVVSDGHRRAITARVIADSGGAFVQSMLVNGGEADGIRRGLAVTNEHGLVGRIVEAGDRSARVLLVIDRNSRIPVVIERSRDRAILAGDNSRLAVLDHLPVGYDIVPGDRVVTSGHDGVLPPGIPVGEVLVSDSGDLRVKPYVKWHRVEFIRVIDYRPYGLVDAPELLAAGARR